MSSMKKNVLAVALVAGLGLAGGAAAYNYGTATYAATGTAIPGTDADSSSSNPSGILTPEPVAYQMLVGPNWNYTMTEDLIFDIQLPDNAVQTTEGFTVRVKLNRTTCVPNGAAYPAPDETCVDTADGALFNTANIPSAQGAGAAVPGALQLNDTLLAAGWTVQFDGYYDGGRTASIKIIPPAGNTANPGPGIMLRWHNAQLTSLNEFAATPNAVVRGEFWMVNAGNDARFVGSTEDRTILQRVETLDLCATSNGAETDKYIDVADDFNEEQIPKTRFSFDGKLGSANDSTGGTVQSPGDYDSQVIDLGDVTLTSNGAGNFMWWGTDQFTTDIAAGDGTDGDGGDEWLAFENGPNILDDVYLFSGTCTSGTLVDQGEIVGPFVTFSYTAAQVDAASGGGFINVLGGPDRNLTVCAFVDTDVQIDDHNNHVTTNFFRAGAVPTPTFADSHPNDVCDLLPLRYNGSTMEIFTINPGSNTTQRSFIRLTNRSQTAGFVSLEGIKDDGSRGDSQVRIWVGAGESVQVNASELESGDFDGLTAYGAWGEAGDGVKWRAVVTAEFPGLTATSLVNSALPRVLSNITDSDTRGEQIGRDFNEGTWGNTPGERPADFIQEWEPDFHGNGSETGEPGGPNGEDGPSGGQTTAPGNPGLGNP